MKIVELTEAKKKYDAEGFLTDPADIFAWVKSKAKSLNPDRITVTDDGIVNVSDKTVVEINDTQLRVKFGEVNGYFAVEYNKSGKELLDLRGFPTKCKDMGLYFTNVKKITNLPRSMDKLFFYGCVIPAGWEGFPKTIKNELSLINGTKVATFKGIHNTIKKVGKIEFQTVVDTTGFLDVMKIPGLKELEVYIAVRHLEKELGKVVEIVNKHLGKGKAGILDAQNELIDANLDKYAE